MQHGLLKFIIVLSMLLLSHRLASHCSFSSANVFEIAKQSCCAGLLVPFLGKSNILEYSLDFCNLNGSLRILFIVSTIGKGLFIHMQI